MVSEEVMRYISKYENIKDQFSSQNSDEKYSSQTSIDYSQSIYPYVSPKATSVKRFCRKTALPKTKTSISKCSERDTEKDLSLSYLKEKPTFKTLNINTKTCVDHKSDTSRSTKKEKEKLFLCLKEVEKKNHSS